MIDYVVIAAISLITSVFSGMLGLGGAVLLIPAYLYLPPIFGVDPLGIKAISGVTSLQVFSAAMLAMLVHRKHGAVDKRLVLSMGIPITLTSLLGAMYSKVVAPEIILGIFAAMAIIAAVMMLMKQEERDVSASPLSFSVLGAIAIAVSVGFFGGMVGAPGAFILSPLMMTLLKIPTRITIGSTLGIVLLSAGAASIGKIATGQVPYALTVVAIAASLPGAYWGSKVSHLLETRTLRWVLAIFISGVGIQMWYRILF